MMDRRQAWQSLMILLAGSALASCAPQAGAPISATKLELLTAIADTLIPKTDTPSASEAGAVAAAADMWQKWANQETRNSLEHALQEIDGAAKNAHQSIFVGLDAQKRQSVLSDHDKATLHAENSNWKKLKELLLLCYYLSEAGATQELKYDLVPGVWRADIPYAEIGRSWAMH